MKTPTLVTRFLGKPYVAVVVCVGCVLVIVGWAHGETPWWCALGALCFFWKAVNAVLDVRRYEQWLAAWQAMNSAPRAAAPRRKASLSWVKFTGAALSLLMIPPFVAAPGTDAALRGALTLLWLGIAVYLLCKVAAAAVRRARISKGAGTVSAGERKAGASADVVKWVLPRASSSPSRAEATRKLPEYCSRLMASH